MFVRVIIISFCITSPFAVYLSIPLTIYLFIQKSNKSLLRSYTVHQALCQTQFGVKDTHLKTHEK